MSKYSQNQTTDLLKIKEPNASFKNTRYLVFMNNIGLKHLNYSKSKKNLETSQNS